MQIQNGQVGLHVVEDGDSSAPPVLVLHGILGSTVTWDWLVPHLTDRYRVLRLDFRGHGDSDRAPGEYVADGWISDAATVCREVAGAPCLVIGHSLGGGTAAGLAQRHPELVRAIALEDPALGFLPRESGVALEGNSLLDAFRLMRESIPQLQASGMTADMLTPILTAAPGPTGETFGATMHPDAIAAMAVSMLKVDATVLDPVLSGTVPNLMDLGAPIPVPTLIVAADPSSPDCVARPEVTDIVKGTSPSVDVHPLPGSNHLIHDNLVQRDLFRALVVDFLASAA